MSKEHPSHLTKCLEGNQTTFGSFRDTWSGGVQEATELWSSVFDRESVLRHWVCAEVNLVGAEQSEWTVKFEHAMRRVGLEIQIECRSSQSDDRTKEGNNIDDGGRSFM